MQQKNSGNTTTPTDFRTLGLDDIIARDDAAELADFMGHSVRKGNLSEGGRSAIVWFRDHTIEMSACDTLAIRIDSVVLDAPSHPALTGLLLSLMSALQQPIALAS